MSSDHIPEGYIALFEASGRYIKARCEGGSPFDKYLEFFNGKQALVEWCIEYFNGNQALPPPPDPVSLDEEQRIGVEVERWFVSVENEFAEPFRKGELTAIYRLRGSEENKVVRPQDWNDLGWPARPFRRSVLAFAGDPASKFGGRTLLVKEAEFMGWLKTNASNRRLTAKAETSCKAWLTEQMRASPLEKPKPKSEFLAEVQTRFGSSERAFDRAWASALNETGASWNRAGRSRKITTQR